MILDDRGMGFFSDLLDNCEADQDEEEDDREVNTDGKETNVDVELEDRDEAEARLRQLKRPGLLRTRLEIAFILDQYRCLSNPNQSTPLVVMLPCIYSLFRLFVQNM